MIFPNELKYNSQRTALLRLGTLHVLLLKRHWADKIVIGEQWLLVSTVADPNCCNPLC